MKPVVLAALLLLAVASLVSGAPTESGIVSDDTPVTFVASGDEVVALEVSGDITKEGKSRYGNETCLPVILQELQIYKIVSLFN